MDAQDATASSATPQREDRAICNDQGVLNGVPGPQGAAGPNLSGENPNLLDQPPRTSPAEFLGAMPINVTGPGANEPPYEGEPDMGANVTTGQATPVQGSPQQLGLSSSPPSGSTVRVQEFYSATSGTSGNDAWSQQCGQGA